MNMGIVADHIKSVLNDIPSNVKLVPISKTMPNDKLLDAWEAGYKVFGENKVQEIVRKHEQLPKDIEWHMVGHLQSNKVRFLAPFVHLIHAVDSLKLLRVMDREAAKSGNLLSGLLQVHIAKEETKFGFSEEEVLDFLNSNDAQQFKHVQVVGLMGMATNTNNVNVVRKEFNGLYHFHEKLKKEYFSNDPAFSELSMGMSGDYKIAIEEGSTMIRIGSLIFGPRQYKTPV